MSSYKTELKIRGIDPAVIAKIDQMVDASPIFNSRNAYLKHYIETLSVLNVLQEQEDKYTSLIDTVSLVLTHQSQKLDQILLLLKGEVDNGKTE